VGEGELDQPNCKHRLEAARTALPLPRSIIRPARGPRNAEMISDTEKVAKTHVVDTPVSRTMSSARIAGR
jgi:hypothetical protein